MATMRETVTAKVEQITAHHERMKSARYGFLVRPVVLVVGTFVILVGLITVPLPGPGWLTVFVGIAILSLEVHWASRVLTWAMHKYEQFFAWYRAQSKKRRYGIVAATMAAAWVTVLGIAWATWAMGYFPALDPVMASFQ